MCCVFQVPLLLLKSENLVIDGESSYSRLSSVTPEKDLHGFTLWREFESFICEPHDDLCSALNYKCGVISSHTVRFLPSHCCWLTQERQSFLVATALRVQGGVWQSMGHYAAIVSVIGVAITVL